MREAAARQVEALRKELEAIEDVDRADFDALRRLGFGTDGNGLPPETAPAENGAAPASGSDGAALKESVAGEERAPAE